MKIRQQTFSGIRWNTLSKAIVAIGSLIQLYVLVRFLEPGDFGLMAMVNVFLFFALSFLDFGVNNGIIYKEEISPKQLSSLYWFTILLSVGLSFLFFVGSPLIARFYQSPQLTELVKILSLVFVISAIGNQYKTLLIKHLKFDALALVQILSFLVGFCLVIYLAIRGYGVHALVYSTIARISVDSFLCLVLGRKIYIPKFLMNLGEVNYFINFGLYQMGERMFNYFIRQLDVLLIGNLLGADLLGFYDVIKRFLMRPTEFINPIITTVLFPVMARVQNNDLKLSEIYHRQLNYICALNFPFYLLLFFNAELIIQLMFGLPWLEYTLVFKIYLLVVMAYSTGNPVGTLILAKGRADLGFYWVFVLFFLISAAVLLGIQWGLEGVVTALFIMQLLLAVPNYLFLVKPLIPTSVRQYFSQILKPLLLALLATFSSTLIFRPFLSDSWLSFLIIACIAASVYLVLNWLFHRRFINDLKELVGL